MGVVTLGPAGTFSHEMAKSMFGEDIRLVSTIAQVFAEVDKTGDLGVLPIENSEAGSVSATLDGLMEYDLFITADAGMRIHHNLASDTKKDEIKLIFAHPQSHEQCSRAIEELKVPVVHTESNAKSAVRQKEHPGSGAIVSDMIAGIYDVPVVMRGIENNPNNETRFVVISKEQNVPKFPDLCSLVIIPQTDYAGLLYDFLMPFKEKKVNLTKIESRPSKRKLGSYVFFLDCACTGDWKGAIKELKQMTTVKDLGCYCSQRGDYQ